MKKLSLFLLVSVFAFCGCSDENDEVKGGDDNKGGENEKKEVVVSFENQLTESESEFTSTSTEVSGYYFKDTFTDPESYVPSIIITRTGDKGIASQASLTPTKLAISKIVNPTVEI